MHMLVDWYSIRRRILWLSVAVASQYMRSESAHGVDGTDLGVLALLCQWADKVVVRGHREVYVVSGLAPGQQHAVGVR